MKFTASINIMPKKELLDPQGKTVANNMQNIDLDGIHKVRIGKHIRMEFDAADANDANDKVETACQKLLANMIMESYEYDIKEA